jgi:hypothetical protein
MRTIFLACALLSAACGDESTQRLPDGGGETDSAAPMVDGALPDSVPPDVAIERAPITRFTDTCVSEPTTYGDYGAVTTYDRFEVDNPAWLAANPRPVEVFVPVGGAASHPVILYNHPYGGTDWKRNRGILEFLVSHDYVVIYAPYPTLGATVCERYDTLWSGAATAIMRLGSQVGMDLSRVGVIGHSFGGGASPYIARQVLAHGWGTAGSFIFSNAPWYTYQMQAADWQALSSTRLLMMVFADDTTNDPRIAIQEVWNHYVGPREYIELQSASDGGSCQQTADHLVPSSGGTLGDGVIDGLDTWGTWRHAQALAACTLRQVAAACALVEGDTPLETTMGQWLSNGTNVTPAEATDLPLTTLEAGTYMFPVDAHDDYPCSGSGGG